MDNKNLIGWSNQDSIKLNYFNICELIAENDQYFSNFKKIPEYTTILEHVDYSLGLKYQDIIFKDYSKDNVDYVMSKLDEIKDNDIYGNPQTFIYEKFGLISPSTIRYIKVLLDFLSNGINLNNKNIVEIGGGYGGQCLIFSKFFNFKNYTIYDLESVTKLQSKYLNINNVFNVCTTTIDSVQNINEIDCVISNYAFAELNKQTQDLYLNKIISKAKSGYFQINPDADECYKKEELIEKFNNFQNPIFYEDKPMNERYKNNFILVFGLHK